MLTSEQDHRIGREGELRPNVLQRVLAAMYDRFNAAVEETALSARRRTLLSNARGSVLDVGAGTGANLAHYPSTVDRIVLIDPDPGMLARAALRLPIPGVSVEVRLGSAESLPFHDQEFDAVVFTLSLCTVNAPSEALAEAARVLKPGGRLLVLEHVRARDPKLARWQDRLAPVQRVIADGCNPNRDTLQLIRQAGFRFEWLEEVVEKQMPLPIVQPLIVGSAIQGQVGERPADSAERESQSRR